MDILNKAGQESKLTEEISAYRNELSKQYGQSRLDVYFWEENWKMMKMCQIFLYQLSPIAWKMKHDRLHRLESEKSIVSTVNLFGRYKQSEEDASLEDLIGKTGRFNAIYRVSRSSRWKRARK